MPRPIIRQQEQMQAQQENLLSAAYQQKNAEQAKQMDKMKLDRLLRKPRSKEYMDAIRSLDAGGHVQNQQKIDEMICKMRQEFPEVELEGVLLGYVSRCYLGRPYEVHTLDVAGGIIEHYKAGRAMPGGLEKARGIAIHGGYEFIEVYVDCLRAVSSNGAVSVISG